MNAVHYLDLVVREISSRYAPGSSSKIVEKSTPQTLAILPAALQRSLQLPASIIYYTCNFSIPWYSVKLKDVSDFGKYYPNPSLLYSNRYPAQQLDVRLEQLTSLRNFYKSLNGSNQADIARSAAYRIR